MYDHVNPRKNPHLGATGGFGEKGQCHQAGVFNRITLPVLLRMCPPHLRADTRRWAGKQTEHPRGEEMEAWTRENSGSGDRCLGCGYILKVESVGSPDRK